MEIFNNPQRRPRHGITWRGVIVVFVIVIVLTGGAFFAGIVTAARNAPDPLVIREHVELTCHVERIPDGSMYRRFDRSDAGSAGALHTFCDRIGVLHLYSDAWDLNR